MDTKLTTHNRDLLQQRLSNKFKNVLDYTFLNYYYHIVIIITDFILLS